MRRTKIAQRRVLPVRVRNDSHLEKDIAWRLKQGVRDEEDRESYGILRIAHVEVFGKVVELIECKVGAKNTHITAGISEENPQRSQNRGLNTP